MTRPRTPRWRSAVAKSSPKRPSRDGEVVVTTRTSPSRHCSTAAWIIRLSPGQHSAVTAVPPIRAPSWIGRRSGPSRPLRPSASWTVATPYSASRVTCPASARGGFVTITGFMPSTLDSVDEIVNNIGDCYSVKVGHLGGVGLTQGFDDALEVDARGFGGLDRVMRADRVDDREVLGQRDLR